MPLHLNSEHRRLAVGAFLLSENRTTVRFVGILSNRVARNPIFWHFIYCHFLVIVIE